MEVMLTDRWKLKPVDPRNWELCELRSPAAGKDAGGEPRWMGCGRFYSSAGIPAAIQYVADSELKSDPRGSLELYRAIDELRDMYREMADSVRDAMGKRGK